MYIHSLCFFFFNDTATTEIYTLSLHDALPISTSLTPYFVAVAAAVSAARWAAKGVLLRLPLNPTVPEEAQHNASPLGDRKSTRLNSSHANISYAVFCLKKKKKNGQNTPNTMNI